MMADGNESLYKLILSMHSLGALIPFAVFIILFISDMIIIATVKKKEFKD